MKIFFLFCGLLFLTSCLQEGLKKPVDPLWGKESCSRCRMVLSEKRYAVQRIFSTGEVHYYDDINCALKHGHGHAHDEGELYVRPYGAEEWILATQAKYLSGLMTPMNSGFGAVKENGKLNFSDIQEYLKE